MAVGTVEAASGPGAPRGGDGRKVLPAARGPVHWLRVAVEAFRQSLWLQSRSRMAKLLSIVGALFVFGLFFLIPRRAVDEFTGEQMYALVGSLLIDQFLLPAIGVWLGLQVIASDREDRVATWLFARPAPRSAMFLGKWVAASVLTTAWIGLALLLLHLGLTVPGYAWRQGLAPGWHVTGPYLVGAALAAPAYAAVGGLVASCFRRPVLFGLVFVAGWEGIVGNLPPQALGVRALTVVDPLRRLQGGMLPEDRRVQRLVNPGTEFFEIDPGSPVFEILRFGVVVLAVALAVFCVREYDLRPKE